MAKLATVGALIPIRDDLIQQGGRLDRVLLEALEDVLRGTCVLIILFYDVRGGLLLL